MKYLLALMLLTLSFTAYADNTKVDAAYGVRYDAQSLKVEIPADSHLPYVTIFATGDDLAKMKAWFDTNAELQRLKASGCHYTAIDTNGKMFKERYKATCPQTPIIRWQLADGTVVKDFKPGMSAESFIRMVNSSGCLRRNCPQPAPDRDPPPEPIINTTPAPKPRFPCLALALLTAVGAGLGVGRQWHDTYYKK